MPDTHLHNSHSGDNPDATLESLIRAAGDYVHPTDDLRPRTLETARRRCRQQRRASGMAIAALLLAVLIPSGNRQQAHMAPFERASFERAPFGRAPFGRLSSYATTQSLDTKTEDWESGPNTLRAGLGPDWALVEIFTQLRRQQAELLHGVRTTR